MGGIYHCQDTGYTREYHAYLCSIDPAQRRGLELWGTGAAITMSIIPPIAVFTVFQNQLVEGMVAGAVKG